VSRTRALQTVLLVDDEETQIASFRRAFVREGKRVVSALDAATARRVARVEKPDLAIVDLRIGGDWGIDVIRDLKADLPETEVALVSGYLSVAVTVDAMRAGAGHVFFKPVTVSTILKQVEEGVVPANRHKEGLPTLARVEWEHLMRALAECGGSVSEAARRLGIRRQSLQRMLKKSVPSK
jgi:two-component system, response regulator RegA